MNGIQAAPDKTEERKGVAVDPEAGSPSSPAFIPQSWIDDLLDLVSSHVRAVKLTREEKFNEDLRRDEHQRRDKPRDDSPS